MSTISCPAIRPEAHVRITDRSPVLQAYTALLLSALFWAGHAVLARGVADHIPPAGLTFWRWLLALAIVLPIAGHRLWRHRALIRAHWRYLTLLAWLAGTGFNILLYFAVDTTSATNAVLINGVGPIFVVGLAWQSFRQPVTKRQALGILFGVAGTLVIVTRGVPSAIIGLEIVPGDMLMILAVSLTAAYSVLLRLRPHGLDDMTLLAAIVIFSLALAVPFYVAEHLNGDVMPLTWTSAGAVVYVGLFASLLAYGGWNLGIRLVGASAASLFMYLIPVFGAGLAILFLGETLHVFHIVGFALVAFGLAFATLKSPAA